MDLVKNVFILDFFVNFLKITVIGFRTIFKNRPHGARKWIVCFTLVFCMSKAIDSGSGTNDYLFYNLQYKLSDVEYGSLGTIFTILMFVSQVNSWNSREEGS